MVKFYDIDFKVIVKCVVNFVGFGLNVVICISLEVVIEGV